AFGVLLDTFVVRSLLVPALSFDIGRAIWWPSKLWRNDPGGSRRLAMSPSEGGPVAAPARGSARPGDDDLAAVAVDTAAGVRAVEQKGVAAVAVDTAAGVRAVEQKVAKTGERSVTRRSLRRR
ncbi:hypothetical protein, partial [Microbacterium sp. zg.Y909]|uniref:hypothetical protein n=1 Tax=Microbacterium sp. zg.Y909 TaxID=2969413 RepID=UPI00214B4269